MINITGICIQRSTRGVRYQRPKRTAARNAGASIASRNRRVWTATPLMFVGVAVFVPSRAIEVRYRCPTNEVRMPTRLGDPLPHRYR